MGSECRRDPVPLGLRHDFPARILENSQASRTEYQVFLQFFRHQRIQTSEPELIV